jgi:hypothetical protein
LGFISRLSETPIKPTVKPFWAKLRLKDHLKPTKLLILMVTPHGLEPQTYSLKINFDRQITDNGR